MIPLVVIVGFLGAGKTRFLSDLLPRVAKAQIRPRVILNDFANAEVDATRLAELEALVTPLSGDCVCCTSLQELLTALYTSHAQPGEVMLIEANGATVADELIAHLSTDGQLTHFTLPLQLTVLDASRWQKRWFSNALEREQLRSATHVSLNWMDELTPARRATVERDVLAVAPRSTRTSPADFAAHLVHLVRSTEGTRRRPPRLPLAPTLPGLESPVHHGAHDFASAPFALPAQVDRQQFSAWTAALPDTVVRAKGLVRFADDPSTMFVWNRVEGKKKLLLDASAAHRDAEPSAIFIGVQLDLEDLRQRLRTLG